MKSSPFVFAPVIQAGMFMPHESGADSRLARFGRRYGARRPREEANAESRFQGLHGVAQRRLRHAELGRAAGEAAVFRDDGEGGQVIEIMSLHSCTSIMTACRFGS
jgi:hypothetical protein